MTEASYEKIETWFRANKLRLDILRFLNWLLPKIVYVSYPLLLGLLAFQRNPKFWRVLFIPAAVFVGVTVIRKKINAKRPYEVLSIHPLIEKNKSGQSFPSRHTVSVFIIAMAYLYCSRPLGIVMLIIGVVIAAIRPIAGIHFPRDVIAGASISLIIGWVFFLLI